MNVSEDIIQLIEEAKRLPAPVTAAAHLYTDLGLDSLSFMELLLRIEEAYNINFELTEIGQCLQVGKLLAATENKLRAQTAPD